MPYVSEEMRAARIAAGLTHDQLAAIIGRSASHMRNVESGDKPLRDVLLSRVVRELNKRLDSNERVTYGQLLAEPPDQPRTRSRSAVAPA